MSGGRPICMQAPRAAHGPVAVQVATAVLAASCAGKLFAVAAVPPDSVAQWLCLPWDDLMLACGVWLAVERLPRGPGWTLGVLAVAYAALNVLMVQALGSPLVVAMFAGFDPAMGDSAGPYVSPGRLLPALVVVLAAAGGALLARRVQLPQHTPALGLLLATGVWLAIPAPGHPAHRNPWFGLVRSTLPRALPAAPASGVASGIIAAAAEKELTERGPLQQFAGALRGRSVIYVVLESAATRFVWPADGMASAMPFLVELGRAGLHCPNAVAVYPESIEGQVPILCALPPAPDSSPRDYAAQSAASLPRRLRPHGFQSGLFHAGRFRFLGMQDVLAPMGFDVLADAAVIGGDRESSFGIDEEATVDALLHWVGGLPAEQRFLACYLPIAGHHPYASPPGGPFGNDTQLGCYRNALHYADRALLRLWRGLLQQRPADTLLLCVVGDHGQAFGEHAGNFGHSFAVYEENLRVPLVFHAPGSGLAGKVTHTLCSHLDVVPTILDLLGLTAGPSLLRRPEAGGRVFSFTDWGELLVAVRDGDWKLIHEVQTARDRLFDLAADPDERENVAARYIDVVLRLRADALAWLAATRL